MISENCCNFKVFKIKSLQTIITIITEDKVTEIFCIADDFCKVFDAQMEKYTIKSNSKRRYHRESIMSKSEIMVIVILFHSSGFRCLKYFYKEYVCVHLRHLFPLSWQMVSPSRILNSMINLQPSGAATAPLCSIFIKKSRRPILTNHHWLFLYVYV